MAHELNVDLKGKIALVTGATGGIGKELARGLARMGATVVIGARTVSTGEAARKELVESTGNADVHVLEIDVSKPKSVRAFVSAFQSKFQKLHLLVNNAGAWFSDRKENPDGIELTFATNVVGPALLTHLLADTLKASAPSRVVNIVSGLAANYDPTDLNFERRKFDGFKVYAASKQAMRMMTWGQAKRFEGTGVTVNAAAPGFVATGFNRNASGFTAGMINLMVKVFGSTPAQGADTPLWVAVAPELDGHTAKYFDKRKEQDGKFRDPQAIAELEVALETMARGEVPGRVAGAIGAAASGPSARA